MFTAVIIIDLLYQHFHVDILKQCARTAMTITAVAKPENFVLVCQCYDHLSMFSRLKQRVGARGPMTDVSGNLRCRNCERRQGFSAPLDSENVKDVSGTSKKPVLDHDQIRGDVFGLQELAETKIDTYGVYDEVAVFLGKPGKRRHLRCHVNNDADLAKMN